MTCIIMTNNPLIDIELINPDVIINYDHNQERFYVTFIATNTGYVMERGHFVRDIFKYEDTIIREMLSVIDDNVELYLIPNLDDEPDLNILFSGRAYNEIHTIWMANCDIF